MQLTAGMLTQQTERIIWLVANYNSDRWGHHTRTRKALQMLRFIFAAVA